MDLDSFYFAFYLLVFLFPPLPFMDASASSSVSASSVAAFYNSIHSARFLSIGLKILSPRYLHLHG